MLDGALQKEVGLVRATKHYLVSIEGLPNAHMHDIVLAEDGSRALVSSLRHDAVEVMMLDSTDIRPGQRFELSKESLQLTLGDCLFGRVVNALTDAVDGKGRLPPKNSPIILERDAGDVASRKAITEQFLTGYLMTDTILPIGKGQRQLLMGPIQSGIDLYCQEVMQNQAGKNMACIYVAVGKSPTQIRRFAEDLFKGPAVDYSCIVASTSEDTAPLNSIAPAVGLQIAEHFCEAGRDVLLIIDDLYTHAKYLREIGLLEGRLPGRESYPGDIFYQQAHLIERGGNFMNKGSITFLPVLQTNLESYTDLIMTNVMGTTDGHMSFSSSRFAQGIFPPVQVEESVTRVGKHTQCVVQKQLSTSITATLADARVQEKFLQFGTQVSDTSRSIIAMGRILRVLLNQTQGLRLEPDLQVLLLGMVFTTFITEKDESYFKKNFTRLCDALARDKAFTSVRERVRTDTDLDVFLRALETCVKPLQNICPT